MGTTFPDLRKLRIGHGQVGGRYFMSAVVTTDQRLLQIVRLRKPATIDEVIDWMNRLDAVFPAGDGLRWFNWLYLLVTKAVKNQPPAGGWNNPQWVTRLDVVFANMYFAAIESSLTGRATPTSWKVLFQARLKAGIDRIQFALAGMNAHINHDLSQALLATDAQLGLVPSSSSPEHDDFEHVNGLLEGILPQALNTLATGVAVEVVQDTGKIGRLLAIWNVRVARDLAWEFADHLRNLNGLAREFALATQDQLTGVIGRSLLLII